MKQTIRLRFGPVLAVLGLASTLGGCAAGYHPQGDVVPILPLGPSYVSPMEAGSGKMIQIPLGVDLMPVSGARPSLTMPDW